MIFTLKMVSHVSKLMVFLTIDISIQEMNAGKIFRDHVDITDKIHGYLGYTPKQNALLFRTISTHFNDLYLMHNQDTILALNKTKLLLGSCISDT